MGTDIVQPPRKSVGFLEKMKARPRAQQAHSWAPTRRQRNRRLDASAAPTCSRQRVTAAKIGRRLKRPPVDGWTKNAVQTQKDIPPLAPTPEGTPHGATDPTGPRFWVGSEPVRLAQVKSKTGVARAWVLGETGRHWSPGSVRVSCGRPHARQGGHAERRHAERWGSLGPWARGALPAPPK